MKCCICLALISLSLCGFDAVAEDDSVAGPAARPAPLRPTQLSSVDFNADFFSESPFGLDSLDNWTPSYFASSALSSSLMSVVPSYPSNDPGSLDAFSEIVPGFSIEDGSSVPGGTTLPNAASQQLKRQRLSDDFKTPSVLKQKPTKKKSDHSGLDIEGMKAALSEGQCVLFDQIPSLEKEMGEVKIRGYQYLFLATLKGDDPEEIRRDLGLSESTIERYMGRLRASGLLPKKIRKSPGGQIDINCLNIEAMRKELNPAQRKLLDQIPSIAPGAGGKRIRTYQYMFWAAFMGNELEVIR